MPKTRRALSRFLMVACAIGALLGSTGCLKVDAKLAADGSATISMRVDKLDAEGDQKMRAQMRSPAIKIVRAEHQGSTGIYELAVTDVRKLRTAPLFRHLRIDWQTPDDPPHHLTVNIPKRPRTDEETNLPEDNYVVIDLDVTFPGSVTKTNGNQAGDNQVQWEVRVNDMLGKGWVAASADYQPPKP